MDEYVKVAEFVNFIIPNEIATKQLWINLYLISTSDFSVTNLVQI